MSISLGNSLWMRMFSVKYDIEYSNHYCDDKKITVWYQIKFRQDDKWSLQLVGLDKREYTNRLSHRKSIERDKKINEILRESLFDKVKNIFR